MRSFNAHFGYGKPDANLLGQLATCHEAAGDKERALKAIREAATVDGWWGRKFNLCLALNRFKKFAEGWNEVERLVTQHDEGPQLVLAAMLAQASQREHLVKELLTNAKSKFENSRIWIAGSLAGLSNAQIC